MPEAHPTPPARLIDMDIIGLELSDVGILAAGDEPARLMQVDGRAEESPGYALQVKKQLLVGGEAFDQARIHPRQTNHRFWSQLSTNPLPEKSSAASSHAEIAYHHIARIVNKIAQPSSEWIVSVPGFMDEAKLGILLGIFRELDVPVKGLVNGAVAAVRPTSGSGNVLHVDAHLHQIEITRCSFGHSVEFENTHILSEGGWYDLTEKLASRLSHEFVRATRFDPLHDARVEQQLYSRISSLLRKRIPGDGLPLELDAGKTSHTLSVLPQMLNEASAPVCERILEGIRSSLSSMPEDASAAIIQLSHRAALVPGLQDLLASVVDLPQVDTLPSGAGAFGTRHLSKDFESGKESRGAAFLSSRSRRSDDSTGRLPESSFPEVPTQGPVPTHLLLGANAFPIGRGPIGIGADPQAGTIRIVAADDDHAVISTEDGKPVLEPVSKPAIWVDGKPVADSVPLVPGQRIQIEGIAGEILVIHVESGDGA